MNTWTGSFAAFVILVSSFTGCSRSAEQALELNLVPAPKQIIQASGVVDVKNGIKLDFDGEVFANLEEVFSTDLNMLFFGTGELNSNNQVSAKLTIDSMLAEEEYELNVDETGIELKGGSYDAVAMGTVTLLQLIDKENKIPFIFIKDAPAHEYRGLMLDLSRAWHSVETIKQVITLARWYKINHLHLHLTDDALFTFDSKAFPKLASPQHYSSDDLKELNAFARARGITIIPEVDVPGHSSGFIRTMPELFGIKNVRANSYTLNMGKEEVYDALDTLFGEVAEAFPDAPYIHIGGDEVFTGGLGDDPDIQKYMAENDIESLEGLYRHFLIRVGNIVKSKGKKVMLWSGFKPDDKLEIPKDFLVMSWNMSGYPPDKLLEDGYTIINASWQPVYVVNNRKWDPEIIYNWSPFLWKSDAAPVTYKGFEVSATTQVMGGSMSSWEQGQLKIITTLRKRLATMSERLWNPDKQGFDNFMDRMTETDARLEKVLYAQNLSEKGLIYPDWKDSNFYESMWFDSSITLSLASEKTDISIRYTLDGTMPTMASEEYTGPITLTGNSAFNSQVYTRDGEKVGFSIQKQYALNPILIHTTGKYNNPQPHSWEKHKFVDSMVVELSSKLSGKLVYTIDGSNPTSNSKEYTGPITLKESGFVRARLLDRNNETIGRPLREEYVRLALETSLTTGKPIQSSNDEYAPFAAVYANNGEIARWDHWGAHTNGNSWVKIDLEKEEEISRFKVYTFWDGYRYYEYSIEVSLDGNEWEMVVDQSKNRDISTPEGASHSISPVKARYVKLNLIRNSANPGLHLVEFQAFK